MIKKLIILFKLGRKVAKSDILSIISKFKEPPLTIKLIFKILSFSLSKKEQNNQTHETVQSMLKSESDGRTGDKKGECDPHSQCTTVRYAKDCTLSFCIRK